MLSPLANCRFSPTLASLLAVAAVTVLGVSDFIGAGYLEWLLRPLSDSTASIVLSLLNWEGLDVERDGNVISLSGVFAYEINYRCAALWPLAIVGIIAVVERGARGGLGLLGIGMTAMLAMNFARLVHLFNVGIHGPGEFALFHDVVWPGFFVLVIGVFWICAARPRLQRHVDSNSARAASGSAIPLKKLSR